MRENEIQVKETDSGKNEDGRIFRAATFSFQPHVICGYKTVKDLNALGMEGEVRCLTLCLFEKGVGRKLRCAGRQMLRQTGILG
jgi:hypothetical protein